MSALPAGWAVDTQQDNRGAGRWGYVLTIPGEWAWVSGYRYGTAEAAFRAGMRDALASAAGTVA